MTKIIMDTQKKKVEEHIPSFQDIAENLQAALAEDSFKLRKKAKSEDGLNATERKSLSDMAVALRNLAGQAELFEKKSPVSKLQDEDLMKLVIEYIKSSPELLKNILDGAEEPNDENMGEKTSTE